jgi:hypothetical protein
VLVGDSLSIDSRIAVTVSASTPRIPEPFLRRGRASIPSPSNDDDDDDDDDDDLECSSMFDPRRLPRADLSVISALAGMVHSPAFDDMERVSDVPDDEVDSPPPPPLLASEVDWLAFFCLNDCTSVELVSDGRLRDSSCSDCASRCRTVRIMVRICVARS